MLLGEDLAGFDALTQVGALGIYRNDVLSEISGFSALTTITGDLEIYDNPALLRLPALVAADISGDLRLENNDTITTLHGMEAVRVVGGSLTITGHAALMDVTALWDVESVDSLVITDNPALATDDAKALYLEIPTVVSGSFTVSGNAP